MGKGAKVTRIVFDIPLSLFPYPIWKLYSCKGINGESKHIKAKPRIIFNRLIPTSAQRPHLLGTLSIQNGHDYYPFAVEDGVDWLQWRRSYWLIAWPFWWLFDIFQA
jgi:hypothetical protein